MAVSKVNPMNNDEIEAAIKRLNNNKIVDKSGKEKTRTQLNTAIEGLNQQAIIDEVNAEYEHVLWDRRSSINGVPAGEVLAHRDDIPPTGAVYLVRRISDGRVLMFQPFVPGVGGRVKMSDRMAENYGKDARQTCVNNLAVGKILQQVVNRLINT